MPRPLRPTDWIPAAVLGALGLYETFVGVLFSPGFQGPRAASTLVVALIVAALLVRRKMPLRAMALIIAGLCLQSATLTDPEETQVSFELFVAAVIVAYATVVHADRLRALQALIAFYAAHAITLLALRGGEATQEETVGTFVVLAFVWVAGSAVRARQERIGQAVTEERTRIARELHDIVAHAVSVMVVQIGAARHTMRASPDVAEESMQLAETAGREALDEMRRLVGLMREDQPVTEPTPGLSSLPELARRFEASGVPVRLEVAPEIGELPAGVDLAAYRVVQEGLTNALKHAGTVPTDVELRRNGSRLLIDIRNGPGRGDGGGSGHGLVGLRERVALYGGTLRAGAEGDGFALRVELPL